MKQFKLHKILISNAKFVRALPGRCDETSLELGSDSVLFLWDTSQRSIRSVLKHTIAMHEQSLRRLMIWCNTQPYQRLNTESMYALGGDIRWRYQRMKLVRNGCGPTRCRIHKGRGDKGDHISGFHEQVIIHSNEILINDSHICLPHN